MLDDTLHRVSTGNFLCLTAGNMSFTADVSTNKKLDGKWCVITGGGQGVGQAIAETFAAEGASIALVARSKDKLEKVKFRAS